VIATVAVNVTCWPEFDGFCDEVTVVLVVALLTVSVAAFDVAVPVPQLFANTALYWVPLALTAGLVTVKVVLVAPVMFVNPEPVFDCH
jgi:hypothetical protein